MAIVKVYADGTGDFTDLRDAVNAQAKDRVALADSVTFELKGAIVQPSDIHVDFAGWITDVTHKVFIKPVAGEENTGVLNTNTTYWSTPNILINHSLYTRDAHVEIRDLEIRDLNGITGNYGLTLYSCLVPDSRFSLNQVILYNCIVYNCGQPNSPNNYGVSCTYCSLHQCTVYCDSIHGGYGGQMVLRYNQPSGFVTNCLIINETIGGYINYRDITATDVDYNADSENLAAGTTTFICTTADMVDFAGGNLSTKGTSSLFTAGESGSRIGAFISGLSTSEITLLIKTNVTGADFVILQAGTNNVIDSVDQEVTDTYAFVYTAEEPIDIGIIKQGYEVNYFYGYTLEATDNTFFLNLRYDRNYQ